MYLGSDYLSLGICNMISRRSESVSSLIRHLSSGLRIMSAADDAAGLAISEKMRSQIRGMNQAVRNVEDSISLIQTAEGNLSETHSILHRIRELVVQASNGTKSSTDLQSIQLEINQLKEEINRISGSAEFNKIRLLDGSMSSSTDGLTIHDGPNSGDSRKLFIENMGCTALGIADLDVTAIPPDQISSFLDRVDTAINRVSFQRASLGATQNVLEMRIDYLNNSAENLTSAESRIRDIDMAKAIMDYTKESILLQVAQALFAQSLRLKMNIVNMLLAPLNHNNNAFR